MTDLLIIRNAFSGSIRPCENPDSAEEWARLGFFLGFQLFEKIRFWRLSVASLEKADKQDGSPATKIEDEAEGFARETLVNFYPAANFWGEESGKVVTADQEILLIVDPIDGTRSFLSGFDTYSVTISILKENKPLFSLICVPSSGDFGYRIEDGPSRVFQYPLFSKEIEVIDLPYIPPEKNPPLLVNIHPSITSKKYLTHLYDLWKNGRVSLVRSLSGSPSLLILEVARGGGVYINPWSAGKTMPFDLITSMHIMLGAGGYMLNLNGEQINPWNHRGMFLAGLNKDHLTFLAKELKAI